jgi:hypothetical protein
MKETVWEMMMCCGTASRDKRPRDTTTTAYFLSYSGLCWAERERLTPTWTPSQICGAHFKTDADHGQDLLNTRDPRASLVAMYHLQFERGLS